MTEKEEESKVEISPEDKDLLLKGVRPEWMDKDMYRSIRKNIQNSLKQYRKGKFFYIANELKNQRYAEDIKTIDKESGKVQTETVIKTRKVRGTNPPYVKKTVKT
jgi:hypothetical protein